MMRKKLFFIFFCTVFFIICGCNSDYKDEIEDEPEVPENKIDYTPSLEHPGILHTTKSIQRMRTIVNRADVNDPAYQSFLLLKEDHRSQSGYTIRGPFEFIGRDGEFGHTKNSFEADFAAAHMNALMWCITRQEEYALKAREILLAYANSLQGIPTSNDAPLLAGFESFRIAFTTEILTHTYDNMTDEDLQKINGMLRNVFLPVLEKFYNTSSYTNGNWGLIITRAYLAMAILWDDIEMYQKGIKFFLQGHDNGTLPNYIDGTTGQCQESGRDQAHTQLGVGMLATICEIAYKQGNDLYSELDNRVLKAYEYTAQYNLGHEVPFKTWTDITGKYSNWSTISNQARGEFRSIYALAYNHYVTRRGLEMPYTKLVLQQNPLGKYDGDGIDYDVFQFADGPIDE